MKKIGILFGQENTFPPAFVERVNTKLKSQGIDHLSAEFVKVNKVIQSEPTDYAVIVDRISQDVPFYRGYLKNAALTGTAVLNNPFWWSADEKFFNNARAVKLGVPVPKTILLPSNKNPQDTSAESFRNLDFPLDWEGIFEHIGFPAYFKPFSGGGWKSVYKVTSPDDFFEKYDETGELVMMIQEEILFDQYFRCYCIDRRDIKIMPYEPRNPHHLRYVTENVHTDPALLAKITEYVQVLNDGLGYDLNTVEFAVRDGIPYAIDFCNPAPDADVNSVGEENFEWVVEAVANMAIRRALQNREGMNNLTWGDFVRSYSNDVPIKSQP
jgi:hypothetical protein